MIMLMRGATLWRKECTKTFDTALDDEETFDDTTDPMQAMLEDLLLDYDACLTQAKSGSLEPTRRAFRSLCYSFVLPTSSFLSTEEGIAEQDPVLELKEKLDETEHETDDVQGNESILTFRPLLSDPSDVLGAQRRAFFVLMRAWKRHCRINVVRVDLKDASFYSVRRMMAYSSARDVARGLHLWSTFPTRIDRVEVIRPVNLKAWTWIAEKVMPAFVSKKVRDKIHFIDS